MTPADPARGSALERHLQTAIAAVLIGLVAWVGVTVTGNREQVGRMEERVAALRDEVAALREELRERTLPIGQIGVIQGRVEGHERRLDTLESAVRQLQGRPGPL